LARQRAGVALCARTLSAALGLAFTLTSVAAHAQEAQQAQPAAVTLDAAIQAGLIPIMIGHGAGSEVMQRIAAPMVGGMVTAPILSMFVISAAWLLLQRRRAREAQQARISETVPTGTPVPFIEPGEVQ
jgi:copper/silver efflux system protein